MSEEFVEGGTTGRWQTVKAVAEGVAGGRRRYVPPPTWFRVLDRFGFPTFFGVVILGVLIWLMRTEREDRVAERAAFVAALANNTAAVAKLSEKIDASIKQDEIDRAVNQKRNRGGR